jgi:hypothetical protein
VLAIEKKTPSVSRCVTTVIVFAVLLAFDPEILFSQTEETADKIAGQTASDRVTTYRYPAVVVEDGKNYSFPNAPAQPAPATGPAAEPPAPFSPKPRYWRNATDVLQSTRELLAEYRSSVIKIRLAEDSIALGTVCSLRDHVVTKLSLVKDLNMREMRFCCGEQTWRGSMVGFDETDDLALFVLHSAEHLGESQLSPVTFSIAGEMNPGKVVVGAGHGGKALSIGMTTVPPINLSLPNDCDDCIDMGLTVGPLMNVTRVYPRTVGERLGMLVGDRIIEFNGMAIKSSAQYRQLEKNVRVGDQVELIVDRGTQRIRIVDVVPDLTKKTKRDRWGGGPFSQRRFGFSKTTVHDSVISPNECGGPLVNLKGQFCGINIARSMRVASMTIPASTVRDFLLRYMDISQLEIQR